MIFLEELLEAQAWVAKRYRVTAACDHIRLAAALDEAAQLSEGHPEDEPAALFFVLTRRARAVPGTWNRLPALVAENHAARLGVRFDMPADEIAREELMLAVAGRLLTFDELRARVAGR